MSSKKRKKRNSKNKKRSIFLILVLIVITILCITFLDKEMILQKVDKAHYQYLASTSKKVILYELDKNEEETTKLIEKEKIVRGKKIKVLSKEVKYEDTIYKLINYNNKEYYVKEENLVSKSKDCVLENTIYIRTSTSILNKIDDNKIKGLAKKGEKLEIVDYDKLESDGSVHLYQIKKENTTGYVYGKYTTDNEEEAKANYKANEYDPIHSKILNSYDGGDAIKLDFYPNEKPNFINNKMPDAIYALYLNANNNTIKNIESYIEFAHDTKINAFVVDIKDNESPAYPADVFKTLSPTNYEHALNSEEEYKNCIQKLKDSGFYVIGRITTFKDSYYVTDHKEEAILNKNTGSPYLHNGSYWPSAYNRNVWYYNVSLAKEAVEKFGFNEINFDYVRFPDRMNSISNNIDLKNTYNEDKTEAIQGFVRYATDILHEKEVYVSIDVFGETTNGTYTTAYGQYWPAISNIADVISGMPYPDHFSRGYYGIDKPWNNPYKLMNYWGKYAMDRQKETPTPAKVRTWIQAYDVMKYVDSNGITYGAKELEDEIRGLYRAGANDGYITWLSNSSLEKYKEQKKAFQIDYSKEYNNTKEE